MSKLTEDDLDIIRLLVLIGQAGRCPFCLVEVERDGPTIAAVRRGLTGDNLRIAIKNATDRLIAEGIDPETMHRKDCRRAGVLAQMESLL